MERKRDVEAAFLKGLEDLANKNFRCNAHKGQANFAPKSIKEKTSCSIGITQDELEQAMNRLFRKNKIESVEEGPASRRRSFIRVANVDDQDF